MAIDRVLVELAFHMFLDRGSESAETVSALAESCTDFAQLRRKFIESNEFKAFLPTTAQAIRAHLDSQHVADDDPVEVVVSPQVLELLFQRVEQQWRSLGETEPYWSVLSDDKFKNEEIDKHIAEFNASGEHSVQILENVARRNGYTLPSASVFELGCGVGRITRFLANRFDSVVAADISPGNLALCEQYLKKEGVQNVDVLQLRKLAEVDAVPSIGGFFSLIVLQHNPPPVQLFLLRKLLGKVAAGGFCFFQVPTAKPGYRFSAEDHIKHPISEMDMHCLPMRHVFGLLAEYDFRVMEVIKDSWSGDDFHSHTFFAVKR
jgi:SAM-dependent methyltransferase